MKSIERQYQDEIDDCKEHIDKLAGALQKLVNEVSAVIGIGELALQQTIGVTNLNVLKLRLEEAEEALRQFAPF